MKTEKVIEAAKLQYPNNKTQQFYRVIRPFIEEVFATSDDDSINVDKFEDSVTGIHVVRQFFKCDNQDYCFWICLFPLLTQDGKKNAFYGIERKNNGNWQSIWSEVPDDKLSLLLRLRVIAKIDTDDTLDVINPFEHAIKNAPASSDIFEQRKIITKIIMDYINAGNEYRRQKETILGNRKFSFVIFKLFTNLYIWTDFYEKNLLECFRLDVIYDENTSFVLFSNMPNDEQIGVDMLMKIINMD